AGRQREQPPDESRAMLHEFQDIIRGVVEEATATGACRADIDPTIATLGLLGMCNWSTRWYRKGGRLTMDAIANTMITMALDGLRPRQPGG
ncbi:MAG TPA: hypothetical protein VH916_06180, partial [Dehalococcoidia bacterium]